MAPADHTRHNATSGDTVAETFPMLPEKRSADLPLLNYESGRRAIVIQSKGTRSMPTKSLKLSSLVVVGTLVLIVASLYWARAVLMPVALAMLLTFLLSPCDSALQRLA